VRGAVANGVAASQVTEKPKGVSVRTKRDEMRWLLTNEFINRSDLGGAMM
jgi:hypothetical protein